MLNISMEWNGLNQSDMTNYDQSVLYLHLPPVWSPTWRSRDLHWWGRPAHPGWALHTKVLNTSLSISARLIACGKTVNIHHNDVFCYTQCLDCTLHTIMTIEALHSKPFALWYARFCCIFFLQSYNLVVYSTSYIFLPPQDMEHIMWPAHLPPDCVRDWHPPCHLHPWRHPAPGRAALTQSPGWHLHLCQREEPQNPAKHSIVNEVKYRNSILTYYVSAVIG